MGNVLTNKISGMSVRRVCGMQLESYGKWLENENTANECEQSVRDAIGLIWEMY